MFLRKIAYLRNNNNSFKTKVAEGELSKCVVDVVKKLMDNKQNFEEIGRE